MRCYLNKVHMDHPEDHHHVHLGTMMNKTSTSRPMDIVPVTTGRVTSTSISTSTISSWVGKIFGGLKGELDLNECAQSHDGFWYYYLLNDYVDTDSPYRNLDGESHQKVVLLVEYYECFYSHLKSGVKLYILGMRVLRRTYHRCGWGNHQRHLNFPSISFYFMANLGIA